MTISDNTCHGCNHHFEVGIRVTWQFEEYHSQCLRDLLRGKPIGLTRNHLIELLSRCRLGNLDYDEVNEMLIALLTEALQ